MRAVAQPTRRGAYVGNLMLMGSTVIWGFNISIVALMLRDFSPLALVSFRLVAGALIFAVLSVSLDGSLKVSRRDLPLLAVAGVVLCVDQTFFALSLTDSNAAAVALLFATTPLFVMLLAWLIGERGMTWRHWAAITVGAAGVTMTILYGGQHFTSRHLVGDLFALIAAVGSAVYILVLRRLVVRHSLYKLSTYVFACGGLLSSAVGLSQIGAQHWTLVPMTSWGEFALSVCIATVLANALFAASLRTVNPLRVAMYSYLEPVVGVVAAGVLLAVHVSILEILGGAVIIAAVIMSPGEIASNNVP